MPSVDVVDLNNAVVGSLELADEVFGAPVNEDLLYEAVRHSQAGAPRRKRQNQDAPRSVGLGQEAVAAKRHRPRAHGFHPVAAVAAWRNHARSATARLQLQAAAQDAAGRAALGAVGQAARRRTESGAGLFAGRSQDQGDARRSGCAGSAEDGSAGGQRRESQPGAERAQSGGREAGFHQRGGRLRSCWATPACCCREAAAQKLSEALAK